MTPLMTLGVVLLVVGVALVVASYTVAGLPLVAGVGVTALGFVLALIAVVTKS